MFWERGVAATISVQNHRARCCVSQLPGGSHSRLSPAALSPQPAFLPSVQGWQGLTLDGFWSKL